MRYIINTDSKNQELHNFLKFTKTYLESNWSNEVEVNEET